MSDIMKVWIGSEPEKEDLHTFTARQALSSVMGQDMEAHKSESKVNINAEYGTMRDADACVFIPFFYLF